MINTKAIKDTSINTIAIGLTSSGAMAMAAGKYTHGTILIATGAGLEYMKYHWRSLENKISKKKK